MNFPNKRLYLWYNSKLNINMGKVNENEESLALFKQMYEEGIPNKEIGDKFGIKANTVCYWAKKLGLSMRGSGKRNRFDNPFKN